LTSPVALFFNLGVQRGNAPDFLGQAVALMLTLTAPFSEGNSVRLENVRFEQFRVGIKRHACTLSGLVAVTPEQKIMVNQMDFTFDGGRRKTCGLPRC